MCATLNKFNKISRPNLKKFYKVPKYFTGFRNVYFQFGFFKNALLICEFIRQSVAAQRSVEKKWQHICREIAVSAEAAAAEPSTDDVQL